MNEILTAKQVAENLQVNLYQVYRLIESGKLKAFNVSKESTRKHYRIKREDLDEFINTELAV